ncbi:MAG: transcription antitermination factor NusB [Rickettsiales bacterium]|nr:transcription antitermination factor NusB [Rickettsiales bacterium]MCA0254123.1 transcription antitermination factor NusB [Pseudomonadota bacterium]
MSTNHQLNSKSLARIAAIQTIYQYETLDRAVNINTLLTNVIDFYKDNDVKSDHEINDLSNLKLKPSIGYMHELVEFTSNNLVQIDKIIEEHLSSEWTLEKLPKLLLAILRVSVSEIKYFPETPRKVVINEYTDIASEMIDDSQVGFVNSLLDKYSEHKG